jgi:hypothetical protein
MATEAPQPSPTQEEISASDPTVSPSLNAGEASSASPASKGAQTARRNDDDRCDRCGLWFAKGAVITDLPNLANLCPDCAAAYKSLAASPIIENDAPPVRLRELFCVVAVEKDTGDEGVMALTFGTDLAVPLVTETIEKLPALLQLARTTADMLGFKYRVYRLSVVEDITDKALSDSAQPPKP